MAKPKEGDTRGWNKKTGTGYKWKGGKWVQYKNNKPQGPFKGHGGITGNVDVVGGLKSQGGRLLRTIVGLPDDEQIKSARKSGEKYRANNKNNKNKTTPTNNKNKSEKEKNRYNPLRIIKDTIRNVNYEKNRRNKLESKSSSNKNRNQLTFGDAVKASGGKRLVKGDMKTKVPASRDFSKTAAEGKTVSFKKGMEANKDSKATKSNIKKSNVFTRHYKTGKKLGVMTRSQRRAYDKEAAGRTFEGQVAKHEKSSGHGKSHKRETLYKASLRKGSKSYKAAQAKKSEESKPKRESITINKDKKKKKRELFEGLSTKFN